MSEKFICPYCDAAITPLIDYEHVIYEGVKFQETCNNCYRNFICVFEYVKKLSSFKAKCLNGEDHNYKIEERWTNDGAEFCGIKPEIYKLVICDDCGHEGPVELIK